MKKFSPLNWTPWGRVALLVALLVVTLVCSTFAAAPAAHAAPAAPAATCTLGFCSVTVWATNVKVHSCLNTNSTLCPVVGYVAGGNEQIIAFCQGQATTVTYGGYTSNWWMEVIADDGQVGWMSNIFIVGGTIIAGVPNCNLTAG